MLTIILGIILSPFAIFCGILSIGIIYILLDKVIETFTQYIKTKINKGNNQC